MTTETIEGGLLDMQPMPGACRRWLQSATRSELARSDCARDLDDHLRRDVGPPPGRRAVR